MDYKDNNIIFVPSCSDLESAVLLDHILQTKKVNKNSCYFLYCYIKPNANTVRFQYRNQEERDKDFKELKEVLKKMKRRINDETIVKNDKITTKGKNTMMDSVKKYYKEHEDVLFPLLVVIVLDHFFNSGALRERIVNLAQGLLDGVQTKLLPKGENDG